jgi:hypothetical protein
MKRTIFCLAVVALALPTACRKKENAGMVKPPAGSEAAKALNAMDQKLASGDVQVQLQVLNQLLQAWVMSKNSFPDSVEDFAKAGTIAKVPAAPPGKKFAIDRQAIKVTLADQ